MRENDQTQTMTPGYGVVSTPDVCGGEPRMDGTRITVASVLGALTCPDATRAVRRYFPTLSEQHVVEAIQFATHAVAARGSRVVTGWAVAYDEYISGGQWLPFTTTRLTDEEHARRKLREGRRRAKDCPHLYRNVRLLRFTRARRPGDAA